nr:MAG TPA: hypothetical protein [Caudoviricetes sp.]
MTDTAKLLRDVKKAFTRYEMDVDADGHVPIAHSELMSRLDSAIAATALSAQHHPVETVQAEVKPVAFGVHPDQTSPMTVGPEAFLGEDDGLQLETEASDGEIEIYQRQRADAGQPEDPTVYLDWSASEQISGEADVQPVAWPNERVNIPDPNNKDARIVGFRIREGDKAWGEHGFSEPLFWLSRVTSTDHQAAVAALEAERDEALAQRNMTLDDLKRMEQRAEQTEASLVFERQILNDRIDTFHAQAALVDQLRASLAKCQREKEGLREAATNLFHSLPDILDEAAFGGNYSKLCDFTDAVHAVEAALNSEGA